MMCRVVPGGAVRGVGRVPASIEDRVAPAGAAARGARSDPHRAHFVLGMGRTRHAVEPRAIRHCDSTGRRDCVCRDRHRARAQALYVNRINSRVMVSARKSISKASMPALARPSVALTVALAWLFPGAGHVLQGQSGKALAFGAALLPMYVCG